MAKYISKPFGIKSRGDRSTPNKTQIAAAYDILSEGEIEGLSDGFASIYINDVPVIDTLANEILKNRNITVNTTANSTSISSSVFGTIDGLSNNNRSGLQLGGRHVLLEKAGKKGTGIASATVNTNTVTTSSSFFTSSLIAGLSSGRLTGYVRISGAGANGTDLVTTAVFVSATEITINALVGTTVSGADIFLDHITTISSISGNTATLASAPGVTISNATGVVTGANTADTAFKNLFNIENLQFGLVTGTLGQTPIQVNSSFGQSSIIASPNIELEQNNLRANIGTTGNLVSGYNNELDEPSQTEGTSADTLLTSAFLDVSNPSEIDEIHLTFNLASCHALKSSSGAKGPSFVELQIFFEYSTDGGSSYTSELAFGPSNNDILTRAAGGGGRKINFFARDLVDLPNNGYIKPSKAQYAAFVEEFVINTEQFQPFDNWRIRVRRINDLNFKDGSFQHTNPCTLTTVESIIKDRFTYPHTAYAYTSFNAKDYDGQVPSRAFALKGMKIQVPTNYRTREETGGAASYTRNISTGAAESSYQNWDGNFRGDIETFNQSSVNHAKVFCDNPVWVMYDMLTNNRYGMGQFVDKENIDKYELFRLAKYCDEEIPDGNGGTEPRFTCNVYLSQAGEATTVLKQLASIFHGMTLWANGEFTATADQPKQPVALFSKANVVDGIFTYEGTGDRVRTNQVKVTWNDPDDNYRQATEYVEDFQDIAEKGRIVRSESLAFGCTSRGQAHRMGKWKLLSERNERETVSFETGQNAIGLLPGQVIGVQDADRDRVSYAGRVSNTGTRSTTVVPLDRTISLPAYDSAFPHELVLMYPKGGAYLIDDNATIGGTAYVKGDLIPSITSSTAAANEEANVEWVEDFTTETQPISTSAGNVSSLTVSSAFTSAPNAETIWALKLYNTDGTQKVGTIKEYKIVGIKEDEGKFSIAAAEYHREKFAEIERGYALQARPTKESADPDDVVPAPTNLVIAVEPMDSSDPTSSTDTSGVITGNKVTITWDYPENSDGSKYKFANGFELVHTFEGEEKTVLVGTVDQSHTINNVTAGKYSAKIRTKTAIGSVSQFTRREIEILESEFIVPGVTRTSLVPTGGSVSASVSINSSSGLLEFGGSSYTLINANGVSFVNTSTNTATYQQSFAGMGASATAFLIFDSSESIDKLKAIEIHTDGEVEYFKEVGASNDGLSTPSGLITIAKGSNQVNGASTAFTTEFSAGDLFKILNGSSTTRTTSGATTTSKSVTLSSANSNIKVGQTVGNIPTQTVDGETVSFGTVFVEAIDGTSLTLSTKLSIPNGTNLSFTPQPVYRRVRSIESDTLLFLDNIVNRPYTSQGYRSQSFKPDLTNDTIIAKITTNGSTVYSIAEQLATFTPAAVTRIGKGFVYFSGWNGTDALPSAPSATSYDFDSTSLQGLTAGWSEDKPVAPYAVAAWTFKEGSASVTFDTVRGVSSWIGIPPDDFRINIDDVNRRIKIRPDVNDSGFDQQIDVPQLYNDRITTNADGTLNNAGGGTAPTVDAITGTTNFQSRVETGLTDAGILDTTVPVGKGGTGQTNTNKFLNSDLGLSFTESTVTLTKAGDTNSTASTPSTLKNSTIEVDSSTGQISGIGTGNNSRVFNDVIGISLDTTTNVGRLTISGVGTSNTTADITKSNLGLQYDDGATVGAVLGTNLKASDGSTTLGDTDVKNAEITLESDGSLANIGTSQILSNSKIVEADLVDSGGTKVFTVKPNQTVLTGNNLVVDGTSQGAVKNSALSISVSGTSISVNGGSATTTTLGKANVGLSDLNSLESGTGTKLSGIETGATVGATAGTNLKDSSNNTLDDEDVRNSDLDIDTDGTSLRIKKGTTLIQSTTLDKGSVGLSDLASLDSTSSTKLGTIETNATVGAIAGTNLKDSSDNTLGDEDVRNDDLQIDYSGTTVRIKKGASTVIDSQVAPDGLKNDQISLTASGGTVTLNNASATNNTFTKASVGLGSVLDAAQVKLDLSNAPNDIKNNQISLTASGGTVTLNNASTTNNTFTKASVGLGSVLDAAQVKLDLSNAPNDIKNTQISLTASNGTVTLNNASTTNNTFTKASVGLGSVQDKSSADIRGEIVETDLVGSGKVFAENQKPNKTTFADNSTQGVFTLGIDGVDDTVEVFDATERGKLDNLRAGKQPTDNTKSILNSDVRLTLATSGLYQGRIGIDPEGVVSGGNTFIDVTKNNLGLDYTDGADVTADNTANDTSNVNSIASSSVTAGAEQAQTNFGNHIQDLKTGDAEINAGSLDTGTIDTNLLKVDEIQLPSAGLSQSGSNKNFSSSAAGSNTFLFNAGSGPGYYQGFVDVDPTSGTLQGGAPNTNGPSLVIYGNGSLVHQSSFPENHVYNSGSGFAASEVGSVHVPFGFYYEGTGTVAVYIRMESTGGTASATVRGRAIKFGAEVASFDTSSFTASRTGITAGANSDSGTVTVSSISSGTTVSLTGNSNATVSINGGTFTSSPGTINNNQTFEIRIPASSTAGVSRSATVTIAGQSVTYTVTTSGTYSGSYGGGGSGGGGFQNEVDLR